MWMEDGWRTLLRAELRMLTPCSTVYRASTGYHYQRPFEEGCASTVRSPRNRWASNSF